MIKTIATCMLILIVSVACAQKKTKKVTPKANTDYIGLTDNTFSIGPQYTLDLFCSLYVAGHVPVEYKKQYMIIIRDTSKMSIKVLDSVFILHISPKFVTKINDSTYTFKN